MHARQQSLRLFGIYFSDFYSSADDKNSLDTELKPGDEKEVNVSTTIPGKNSPREIEPNGLESEMPATSAKTEVETVVEVPLSKPSVDMKAPPTEISQSSDLLNGIDLDALDMEMNSMGQQQSAQQPVQLQSVQQQPVQPQLIKPQPLQPQTAQPQTVHQPQQQHPQVPASFSRSPVSSPPSTRPLARSSPQQQFPPAIRNQTMLQNIQQSSIIRGPNGQPMIHPPVSGNPQYIQTAQNNAFSTKRTGSFISLRIYLVVT